MKIFDVSVPIDPPDSRHFDYATRRKLAAVAKMFVEIAPHLGKDAGDLLTVGLRNASAGRVEVKRKDIEGLGPSELIDTAGVLAMVCHDLKLDLSDERVAESVEEYARKCVELYRGMPG